MSSDSKRSPSDTAELAPRLAQAAAAAKVALDKAGDALKARKQALEAARLNATVETLGECVLHSE